MHIKRIAVPKSWPLAKKGQTFIIKGRGPYPQKLSLPILVILRDILKEVRNRREAKKILQESLVLVDNKIIKDEKFGVGIFSRIYIKKLEKAFTLYLTKKGKLKVQEISKEKASKKYCKIIGKKTLKGNKIQLNLYDGKNFIIDKKRIGVGDTAIVDLKNNKIVKYLKLDKAAFVFIIGGKHIGDSGKISEVDDRVSVIIKSKPFKISKENVFVVEEGELK